MNCWTRFSDPIEDKFNPVVDDVQGGGGTYLGMSTRQNSQPVATPRFLRRLGPDPHANGAQTVALKGCPDIFELESGDFAIIGSDITTEATPNLPPTASCGPDERIIRVPRKTLVLAKQDIPNPS
jgi:hypothetical protein